MTLVQSNSAPDRNSKPEKPTSDLLIEIVEACPAGEITVGALIDGLGDRAFGIVLLILTLPVAVPGPPGLPLVFGTPMLIFTAQLFTGRHRPWMPEFIRRRRFSRDHLLSLLHKVKPALARIERICRPRLLRLTTGRGERAVGVFFFLCALVVMNPIPIPFSHLPLGIALAVLALGYVERDGVVVILGLLGAIFGVALNLSLTGGLFAVAFHYLHSLVH